jgi:hypothetical protein
MKRTYLLYSLPHLFQSEKIIKNAHLPACRNCIHYQPNAYNDFTSSLNKCNKFGTKDIITDEIIYDYADSSRNDDSKCGKEGKYFEAEPNINMKILKYSICKNIPNGILLLTCISLIIAETYVNVIKNK